METNMKKILSNIKAAIILLAVAVIALGFYGYMLLRPISYGMPYQNVTEYVGGYFEGTQTYYPDGTVVTRNTNFEGELVGHYYYKDGYIFSIVSETDEEIEAEIAEINADFEGALEIPFYAGKIDAFKQAPLEVEGYTTVYTCNSAVVFAVAFGIFELALIALTAFSFVLAKKTKVNDEQI